jgi:DNA-3-methyladenine glycosylase II
MATFTLEPVPPFDFDLTAAIFASGDPQFRIFRDGIFRHALEIGTTPVLAEVRSSGTHDTPRLSVTIRSDRPITNRITRESAGIIAQVLGIADDLSGFYLAMDADPVMADLVRQLNGLRAPVTPTVFEALTDSVIEQQISLKAARSIENRLIRTVGRQLHLDNTIFYTYPDAEILAQTTDSTFRSLGLTIRKGEYIRDISRKIIAGDLDTESFRQYQDTESIISEMVKLRGIGRWTAELTILRGLHRPDAFPADDVGVRRFISQYYREGQKISSSDARSFAERWGTWKGFAAYYLEVADLLGIHPRTG